MTANGSTQPSPGGPPDPRSVLGARWRFVVLGVFVAFVGISLGVYRAAFDGPFVSDDSHWVAHNPYLQELNAENLVLIARPLAEPSTAIANYSPVALMILGLERQLFGPDVTGYHIVNVCLHALASVLLIGVLLRSSVPAVAALLGGAFFLLHPANVEAVAWISQVKTTSSMVFGLGAVLTFSRRPAVATLLFVMALLAKPTAFVVIPFLAIAVWVGTEQPRWGWLVLWLALLAAFSIPELLLQQQVGIVNPPESDPVVRFRSILAFAGRYLVMATSSHGVSAFHQPELARSWLDPWWLAGIVLVTLLGWRTVWALRRRRVEAAWWLWAALSFGPISQIFPFIYPMADRYLYFILPGLIGGAILSGRDLACKAIPERSPFATSLTGTAAVITLAVLAIFAVHSYRRAGIWASNTALFLDGATNYPRGIEGRIHHALRALREGDRDEAIRALHAAHERGFSVLESLIGDPALDPLRSDPRFEALIRTVATELVESRRNKPNRNVFDLPRLAEAHLVLGENKAALAVLDQAEALRGSAQPYLRERIAGMRRYAEQELSKAAIGPEGESGARQRP